MYIIHIYKGSLREVGACPPGVTQDEFFYFEYIIYLFYGRENLDDELFNQLQKKNKKNV